MDIIIRDKPGVCHYGTSSEYGGSGTVRREGTINDALECNCVRGVKFTYGGHEVDGWLLSH